MLFLQHRFGTLQELLLEINNTVRSEDESKPNGVSLKLVDPTPDSAKPKLLEKLQARVTRASSVDKGTVSEYIVAELKEELDDHNDEIESECGAQGKIRVASRANKDLRVDAVIQARTKLIAVHNAKDPPVDWKALQEARVRASNEAGLAASSATGTDFKERVAAELDNQFYTYAGTQAREEYSQKKHSMKLPERVSVAGGNTGGDGNDGEGDGDDSFNVAMSQGSGATGVSSPSTGGWKRRRRHHKHLRIQCIQE